MRKKFNLNEKEIVQAINKTMSLEGKNTDFRSLKDVHQYLGASSQNEQLLVPNKLTKMLLYMTFKRDAVKRWKSAFTTYNNETLEIGAVLEIVSNGLLEVKDDTITTATDLLPDLDARPIQYAKDLIRNIKSKIDLTISESIWKRAFLTVNGFNEFLNNTFGQILNTMEKFMYEKSMEQIFKTTKNVKKIIVTAPSNPGDESELIQFAKAMYRDIATNVPYSKTFNLGALAGAPTIPAETGTDNSGGGVYEVPVKTNTMEMTGSIANGVFKYPELNLLVRPADNIQLNTDLANIYHDTTLSYEGKFNELIMLSQEIQGVVEPNFPLSPEIGALKTYGLVIDYSAYVEAMQVKANKTQFWAAGEGEGLRQIVDSFWYILAVVPWANGRLYLGGTAPTETVENDEAKDAPKEVHEHDKDKKCCDETTKGDKNVKPVKTK